MGACVRAKTQPPLSIWLVGALLLDTARPALYHGGLRMLQQLATSNAAVEEEVCAGGEALPLVDAEFTGIVRSLIEGLFIPDSMERCALLLPYASQLPCPLGSMTAPAHVAAVIAAVFLISNGQLARVVLPMLADALPGECSSVAHALRTQASVAAEYVGNVCAAAARLWLPNHATEIVTVITPFARSSQYRALSITCLQALLHEPTAQSCMGVFIPLLTEMISTQQTHELVALLARSRCACMPAENAAPAAGAPSAPPSHVQPPSLMLLSAVANMLSAEDDPDTSQ